MNIKCSHMMTKHHWFKASLMLLFTASLLTFFTSGIAWSAQPIMADSKADVTVYKTEFCGCCSKWTDHLEQSGLSVNVIVVKDTRSVQTRLGVPRELGSCHTAVVGDYWVEGHVPADLINQLLVDQPENIKGIAAPGMPPGSPGMDVPNSSSYKVFSVDNAGKVDLYATPKGSSSR